MNRYHGLMSTAEHRAMLAAVAAEGVHGALADDALQEAAVRYWRHGASGAGLAYRIARQATADLMRALLGRNGHKRTVEAVRDDRPADDDPESQARVMQALRRMRPADVALAEVLATSDGGRDAARMLGVSPSCITLRTRPLREALARFVG